MFLYYFHRGGVVVVLNNDDIVDVDVMTIPLYRRYFR